MKSPFAPERTVLHYLMIVQYILKWCAELTGEFDQCQVSAAPGLWPRQGCRSRLGIYPEGEDPRDST